MFNARFSEVLPFSIAKFTSFLANLPITLPEELHKGGPVVGCRMDELVLSEHGVVAISQACEAEITGKS